MKLPSRWMKILFTCAFISVFGFAINYRINPNVVYQAMELTVGKYTTGIPKDLQSTLENMYNEIMIWDELGVEQIISSRLLEERCSEGFYKFNGKCKKLMNCKDILSIENGGKKFIAKGTAKEMFKVTVNNLPRVLVKISSSRLSTLSRDRIVQRAQQGMKNLLMYQPSPYVLPVMGHCLKNATSSAMIVEGCFKYLSLKNMILMHPFYHISPRTRFRMAIQIVAEIDFLHRSGKYPRVHCDLHGVYQSLAQFLVTDSGQVVMNDLDMIPEVDGKTPTYCKSGKKNIDERPPELRFTLEELKNHTANKPATEKSDIWKIPNLTQALVVPKDRKINKTEKLIMKKLQSIHNKCWKTIPTDRPTSKQVLIAYLQAYQSLFEF